LKSQIKFFKATNSKFIDILWFLTPRERNNPNKYEMKQTHVLILLALVVLLCSCTDKKKKSTVADENTIEINADSEWKMVWSDEFNTEVLDTLNWNFQVEEAGRFNEEWQRYTNSAKNTYVENDQLVIRAIHESDTHGMDQYTSARLHTANKQSWKYGKIAARIKLPTGKGIWPAFWMLGNNIDENGGDTSWPQSGEVDILELYGSKNASVVEANIHYANEENKHKMMGAVSYQLETGEFSEDFHLFELEWNQEKFVWSVDGKNYASVAITSDEMSEFHKEFFLLLNVAVGGSHAGRPDESTPFPQYMYVDWIRVYQK
jgi:beta-glucanase (GH16 family)